MISHDCSVKPSEVMVESWVRQVSIPTMVIEGQP
jgi:hypothetical protein